MNDLESTTDVEVTNCGSIVQFHPITESAIGWFDDNVQSEGWQYLGVNRLNIDARYAGSIIDGLIADGMEVVSV